MYKKLFELKNRIKGLSEEQKVLRPQRKEKYIGEYKYKPRYSFMSNADEATVKMRENKYELRHLHIAYCLLRDIPYEKIESKVVDNNTPSWSYIEMLKKEYAYEETVCACAV